MTREFLRQLALMGFVVILIFTATADRLLAIDIGSMTWTPRADWINVKSCSALTGGPNAVGDGTTNDAPAIQAVFNYLQAHYNGVIKTVYFPPATYAIQNTLTLTGVSGIQIVGCGSNTTISWTGPSGSAMFHPSATTKMRYTGIVWEGNNSASCAYEEASQSNYETDIRHENESFHDFTVPGTYSYYNASGALTTTPAGLPGGIICGFPAVTNGGVTGECMVYNCQFDHCSYGIVSAWQQINQYMWDIDHCEFENCGIGFDGGGGYSYTIANCHFQQSTSEDIWGGGTLHVRNCTSSGSGFFLYRGFGVCAVQDCWVDGWTNTTGAISFATVGPDSVFDCTFTHPPSGATAPVELVQASGSTPDLLLSNNYAPNFPSGAGLVNTRGLSANIKVVPSGTLVSAVTSPTETFLQTAAFVDSSNIIDVTLPPYSADKTGTTNASPAIQSAITAAQTANNGSVVYIPGGFYKISSTLTATDGNYTIQGAGFITQLCWYGGSGGTMMTVTSPQNITVERLQLAALNNILGASGYSASDPITDPTTVTGLKETATGVSSIVYDDVYYDSFQEGNRGATGPDGDGPGIVLSNLPSGSTVVMPHPLAPLTVQNCGPAVVFSNYLGLGGILSVSGTGAKTGFLGVNIAEGGQTENTSDYNIVVTDNQDLVVGGFYSEQTYNNLNLQRGGGTGTGRVTIEGFSASTTGLTTSININNYSGRLLYGLQDFLNDNGSAPVQITQTGANPIDLILAGDIYTDGAPSMTVGTGANLIETLNMDTTSSGTAYLTDTPNPLTVANLASLAQGLDHLRELAAFDLSINNSVAQLLSNTSAELDAINPNPTTAIGYNPASWTVTNSLAVGGGSRNFTVVGGASPFGPGAQSMLWVDTTGTNTGSGLSVTQTGSTAPSDDGAIQTFDFQCNSSGTANDLWVSAIGAWGKAGGVHITSNGTTGRLSANVGTAGDTYLGPFSVGVWYRAQVVLGAPNAGTSTNATLYLTPWTSSGPGTPVSYTIRGVPATETEGYSGVLMTTGGAPGASQNINIDNLGLVANAVLTVP